VIDIRIAGVDQHVRHVERPAGAGDGAEQPPAGLEPDREELVRDAPGRADPELLPPFVEEGDDHRFDVQDAGDDVDHGVEDPQGIEARGHGVANLGEDLQPPRAEPRAFA